MTYYVRNLPHWQPPGQDLFITWRLKGSLPASIRSQNLPSTSRPPGEQFRAFDRAQTDPLWLRDPRIAQCVIAALRRGQQQLGMFQLHAYVVMANHVHVLLEPRAPIAQITHMITGATAREANRTLGLTGKIFWQDESFDHWVRNPDEWNRIRAYIERTPVAAGLVEKPEDWPWSSATRRPQ